LLADIPQLRAIAAEGRTEADDSLSRLAETRLGLIQYLPRDRNLARSLDWYGEWLQPQIDLIGRHLLRPGATVIDANSGIGVYALALARALGPQGHVFAYEADPILHRILAQNLELNGVRPLVTVLQRKLTSREASQTSMGAREHRPDSDVPTSDTIDELMLERLDLVKLNECSDPRRVLEGGEATIWRCRPIFVLEQPTGCAFASLAAEVKRFSYRCWEILTPLFSRDNYNRRSEDIFHGETATILVALPEEAEGLDALHGCREL